MAEYRAEFQESGGSSRRKAKLALGDYESWDEVLSSKILWGSINFTDGDTITLKKDESFPTETDDVTFFHKGWTYVRVLKITKSEHRVRLGVR